MKCNVPQQPGKQKPSKFALIKNKKKIQKVGELGILYDKLEAQYNQSTDPAEREEIKAKMEEIEERIKTMSAEIKAEVYKKSNVATATDEEATAEDNTEDNTAEETLLADDKND